MAATFSSELIKDIQRPSIDRPFGIELWPIFDKAFTAVKGYHPQDFKFVPGETPMSTMKETAAMIITYYIIILGGRELMRNRPAFKLNGPFMVHNFYLTAISGALLVLFAEQLIPEVYYNGIFHAICHVEGGWTNKLVILYYLNYLTKYLELIDTVFLVLKKKPLSMFAKAPYFMSNRLTELQPSFTATTTAPLLFSATPSSLVSPPSPGSQLPST